MCSRCEAVAPCPFASTPAGAIRQVRDVLPALPVDHGLRAEAKVQRWRRHVPSARPAAVFPDLRASADGRRAHTESRRLLAERLEAPHCDAFIHPPKSRPISATMPLT